MPLFRRKKQTEEQVEKSGVAETPAQEDAAEVAEPTDQGAAEPELDHPEPPPAGTYRKVRVWPGPKGWGKGFIVEPKPGKDLIYSVTGGGIHPVAARIAELSGGRAFDGFKSKADFDEIAVAVIDCGGTARIGVYPMKGVLTVDIHGASPSGPLMRFITEENFVSGVTVETIEIVED